MGVEVGGNYTPVDCNKVETPLRHYVRAQLPCLSFRFSRRSRQLYRALLASIVVQRNEVNTQNDVFCRRETTRRLEEMIKRLAASRRKTPRDN